MIITEEEFREQRKIAIARLEELKKIEENLPMECHKIDDVTWVSEVHKKKKSKKEKKKYRHVLPSERMLEEFFIDNIFDGQGDEIIYIY